MFKRKTIIAAVVILGLVAAAVSVAVKHPSCSLVANPSPADGADGTEGAVTGADGGDSSGG